MIIQAPGTIRRPMSKRFYITTAIYYVNSAPHIGSAQEAVLADVVARFQRMSRGDAYFLTGTDENATKVLETAQAAGKDPKAFVDEVAAEFKRVFDGMHLSYNDFIRTTEPRHVSVVQEVFRRLQQAGHIYKGEYEGWYDVRTETFFKESELVEGKSPDGNDVRWVKEENYFFRLSAFQDRILSHIENHPDFILPDVRRNEVVSFIGQGLRDACITRATTGWGIPVPGDESQVIYVWFDALVNYISAIGWPDGDWEEYWPADMQLVGKDILVRFHATLWPAMLMGLELPLPKTLVGHGWTLMGQEKISKSTGNVVAPLDLAQTLVDRNACDIDLAVDCVRYYMMRIAPYESDSTFTFDDFDLKFNAELVNDISNGVHRVISMTHSFCDGVIPSGRIDQAIVTRVREIVSEFANAMNRYRVDEASAKIPELASVLNHLIDTEKPWDLKKNSDPRLADVMVTLAYVLRAIEGVLRPITPMLSDRVSGLLNLSPTESWQQIGADDCIPANHAVHKPTPLLLRLEKQKKQEQKMDEQTQTSENLITIEDFLKVKLKVGRVLDAHRIDGADKLLRLELIIGDERRQVLAGIAQQYTPEDIIGRQVVVVTNLAPRKLRGYESQGMILAADAEDGGAILLMPDKAAPEGTHVH